MYNSFQIVETAALTKPTDTNLVYRRARTDDIEAMADLFIETVSDLYHRHGQARQPPPRAFVINNYTHILNTGNFWLVELDGQLATIAGAILRDRLWFLSAFWTRPALQGQGFGSPLLRQMMQAGKEAGADTFFVWSSVDPPALANYMKMGMLPGYPLFFMEVPVASIWQPPHRIAGYQVEALDPEVAMRLDERVRGTRRPQDHVYFVEGMHLEGRMVISGGEPIGYYYLGPGGIAPAAWSEPEHAPGLLAMALDEGKQRGGQVRLYLPGVSHTALRFVLAAGLHLTAYAHILLSRSFGALDQYLPSGPGVY